MFADELREYLLGKTGATEGQPFGPDVLVYKVADEMFAFLKIDDEDGLGRCNLKCDPARAELLRSENEFIQPGYHMNKKHWNTLVLDPSLPDPLIKELVDHSWELVVSGLTKKARTALLGELE